MPCLFAMLRAILILAAGIALLSAPARAQDNPPQTPAPQTTAPQAAPAQDNAAPGVTPPESTARFSFNRVDDGFVRLDKVTGQVAMCSARAVGWACQAMPEEREALEKEILKLSDENVALKKELAARASPPAAKPEAGGSDQHLKLPTDEDLNRAMAFIEKVWRRLVEMIANMQKEMMRKV